MLTRSSVSDGARGSFGDARAAFDGDYVELPDGVVRYRLRGSPAAPTIVMIGGLSTTMDYFDRTASALAAAAYRTLQFDLYGRGGSARPPLRYDRAAYQRQIDALLEALRIDQPVFAIGQSLGGGIAASYAAARPSRVRALSLHASAGFLARPPRSLALVRTPWVGSYVFRLFGVRSLVAGVDRYFYDAAELPLEVAQLRRSIRDSAAYPGYRQAVLNTLRNFPLEDLAEDFCALGKAGVPVQLVWGRADAVIPLGDAARMLAWLGTAAQLVTFDRVGHMPLLEAPDRVLPAVRAFFDARRFD